MSWSYFSLSLNPIQVSTRQWRYLRRLLEKVYQNQAKQLLFDRRVQRIFPEGGGKKFILRAQENWIYPPFLPPPHSLLLLNDNTYIVKIKGYSPKFFRRGQKFRGEGASGLSPPPPPPFPPLLSALLAFSNYFFLHLRGHNMYVSVSFWPWNFLIIFDFLLFPLLAHIHAKYVTVLIRSTLSPALIWGVLEFVVKLVFEVRKKM